ncbi:hypothetical protein MIDIC_580001 [Alphaproteobacteria bacterium]
MHNKEQQYNYLLGELIETYKSDNATNDAKLISIARSLGIDELWNLRHMLDVRLIDVAKLRSLKLSQNVLNVLFSWNAFKLYQKKITSFSAIQNLSLEKLKILLSFEVRELCRKKIVEFNVLQNLELEKLKSLVSFDARELYNKKLPNKISIASFYDLKNLELERLKILISYDARELYERYEVSFNALKDLPIDRLKMIISWKSRELYKQKIANFDDLKDLELQKFEALSSWQAMVLYGEACVTFSALKILPLSKLAELQQVDDIELQLNDKILKTLLGSKYAPCQPALYKHDVNLFPASQKKVLSKHDECQMMDYFMATCNKDDAQNATHNVKENSDDANVPRPPVIETIQVHAQIAPGVIVH